MKRPSKATKKVLVIGDSYAAGVGGTPNWLDILGIPKELRLGKPGSTAAEWAKATPSGVACDAVVISLLGNDAMKGGSLGASDAIVGIENLIKVFRGYDRPGIPMLLFLYPDPFVGTGNAGKVNVGMINRAIKIARMARPTALFVDLGAILDKSCFDGKDIHPKAKGQAKMAEAIAKLLP